MEYEKTSIYCPLCKRKVAVHDGRGTLYIDVKCGQCNKLVIYKPDTKETIVRRLPERATSSGLRFY
jgi:endogenous inhibitor of DNA gyrase (YacG/DUF329 family)